MLVDAGRVLRHLVRFSLSCVQLLQLQSPSGPDVQDVQDQDVLSGLSLAPWTDSLLASPPEPQSPSLPQYLVEHLWSLGVINNPNGAKTAPSSAPKRKSHAACAETGGRCAVLDRQQRQQRKEVDAESPATVPVPADIYVRLFRFFHLVLLS